MSRDPLVTRIHGRYYDLGAFDHPGGCAALECARDRDATDLFESYHVLHRAQPLRALRAFEIAHAQADAPHRFLGEKRFGPSPYDWPSTLASPFARELTDYVRRYFDAERRRRGLPSIAAASKAPPRRWLEIAALGLIFFTSLAFHVRGSWIAMFVTPVAGWLFLVNYWHDALHFGLSRRWRLNALLPYLFPWFISPKLWMHQHVVGHHVHPNDPDRDPDVRAAPRLIRQNPGTAWCPAHAGQQRRRRLVLLYSALFLVRHLVKDHLTHLWGWFNDAVPLVFGSRIRRMAHVAGRLLVAYSLFVWPFQAFPFWKALAFAIVPSLILSELFLLCSQVNHITDDAVEGAARRSTNWFEAQALASCNFAPTSYLAFLASGGLNLQIEHHLFPGVNHAHLFRLAPGIREICERHGVRYHCFPTFAAALRSHFTLMRRLARPTAAQPATKAASEEQESHTFV